MHKTLIFVLTLGFALVLGAPQAKATDPCDPTVFSSMSQNASAAFKNLSEVATTLMQPSPPAASSNCMRNLFNIWNIDPAMFTWSNVASLLPSGVLGYTLGGFTLSQSSNVVWQLITPMIQSYFSSKFGNMICGELWNNVGQAMASISFETGLINTGGINIGPALIPKFGGSLGGLVQPALGFAFGGSVSFKAP